MNRPAFQKALEALAFGLALTTACGRDDDSIAARGTGNTGDAGTGGGSGDGGEAAASGTSGATGGGRATHGSAGQGEGGLGSERVSGAGTGGGTGTEGGAGGTGTTGSGDTGAAGGGAGSGGMDATGGTNATGRGGAGGAVDTAGSAGATSMGAVACPTPTAALITDFTLADDATDTTEVTFGDFAHTFSGGTVFYPDTLASDMTTGAWHLTGIVEDFTGFGLYLMVQDGGCGLVDASAFKGFAFTVSGILAEGRKLMMWLSTAANSVSYAWLRAHDIDEQPSFGRCEPVSDNLYDGTCASAVAEVPLSDTPTSVSLQWSDFTGGRPEIMPNAAEITGFGFYLAWGGDNDTPYQMDITLDELSFIE